MDVETHANVALVVKAWLDAFQARRAADPDTAGSKEWDFSCRCDHQWDAEGDPPKWVPTISASFWDDVGPDWTAGYDYLMGSEWFQPYPTYRSLLDPAAPFLNDREAGDGSLVQAIPGPDVLELHARLLDLGEGVSLLPEEGMGGDADIGVEARGGAVKVVLSMRAMAGGETQRLEFKWGSA